MQLAPAGVPLTFEVTFAEPSLPVAMSVYDTSGSSPVLVQGPTAMLNVSATNTYIGNFTASNNKTYLILKAVYTDDTYEDFDTNYGQGSETIVTNTTNALPAGNALVGFIQC